MLATVYAVKFWHIIFGERRAHAPLGAGSEVAHGFKGVITGNHVNRTAPSGCVARLVLSSLDWER